VITYDFHVRQLYGWTQRYWVLRAGAALRMRGHDVESAEFNELQQTLPSIATNSETVDHLLKSCRPQFPTT
jgi:hypothetical protein